MALSVTILMGFDWTTEIKLFKDRIHTNHTFEHQLAEILNIFLFQYLTM